MSEVDYTGFGVESVRKAMCPECEKETRVDTLFHKIENWTDEGPDIEGRVDHFVFECRGCEVVFFARSTSNSEDYYDYVDPYTGETWQDYRIQKKSWPSVPQATPPIWANFNLSATDKILSDLLHDIYHALNNDLYMFAAIGCRTVFDRISEVLGIDTELSFAEKLEEMRKASHISGKQKGTLEVLVDAGSAAAHRGWKPERKYLDTMLDIIEQLIHEHFVLKAEIADLKKAIPARK